MFKKDKVQSLIVPAFKEHKVKEIWDKIKDFDEYNLYFPDFTNSKLPERDDLISIISTINPDVAKKLVKEAREIRSITQSNDPGNLVGIKSEIIDELRSLNPQKSNYYICKYFIMKLFNYN